MIVAVDGPAASGKGTLARRLAGHLGFAYLDTGALYRAVALAVLRAGGDPGNESAVRRAASELDLALADSPAIRDAAIGDAASKVAALPSVRRALFGLQRGFAADPPGGRGGAVLDGRDIGTVICPEASRKIYVTADIEIRAERRFKELLERGEPAMFRQVLEDLRERDARDASRAAAPLRRADDAFVLDTTRLDPDAAFERALAFVVSGAS